MQIITTTRVIGPSVTAADRILLVDPAAESPQNAGGSLTSPQIGGIVGGVLGGLLLFSTAGISLLILYRQRWRSEGANGDEATGVTHPFEKPEMDGQGAERAELGESYCFELSSDDTPTELSSHNLPVELEATSAMHELIGGSAAHGMSELDILARPTSSG